MNLIVERAIHPRESTPLLFQPKKFSDLHGLLFTFLGLFSFGAIPRLLNSSNQRPLVDNSEVLTTIIFPTVFLSFLLYFLYAGLLFLSSKIFSGKISYKDARYLAGGSFWIPLVPLAPFALIGLLLTGGEPIRPAIANAIGLPGGLILISLLFWGLIIHIQSVSQHTGRSITRSSVIVLIAGITLLVVTVGPFISAFLIFG